MAYSELIKSFERVRSYIKDFYVYGFKTRGKFDRRSGRSYDNERRRIESYLGDYVGFKQTQSGKNVFLSIDSRTVGGNPLYRPLKAKSFTDGDITLNFIIFDILHSPEICLSSGEITALIDDEYLAEFSSAECFDESTVRKKLKEYCGLGLLKTEKRGKCVCYRRAESTDISFLTDAIEFYSEAGACGAIGSFLLDKTESKGRSFSFKHHYITGALDSEVLCGLLKAIHDKKSVNIAYEPRGKNQAEELTVIPLKILVSAQNGRQYLFACNIRAGNIYSYRIDFIHSVCEGSSAENFDGLLSDFEEKRKHMWGASLGNGKTTEKVEFTVHFDDCEDYIYRRLLREKRCGEVVLIDKNTCKFSAEVYDTMELFPWIRSFICRITELNFSDRTAENQFRADVETMYRLYGLGGEE